MAQVECTHRTHGVNGRVFPLLHGCGEQPTGICAIVHGRGIHSRSAIGFLCAFYVPGIVFFSSITVSNTAHCLEYYSNLEVANADVLLIITTTEESIRWGEIYMTLKQAAEGAVGIELSAETHKSYSH